jgi:uncharacterized protein (DUF302 family)
VEFYLTRPVDYDFDTAVERATAALKDEGFGILTEIDVKATLKAKLDAAFRPYRILGACNPPLAQQALAAEPYIGALMPCNVFIQQREDGGVEVSVMNPATLVPITGNAALQAVQDEVTARIGRVLAAL